MYYGKACNSLCFNVFVCCKLYYFSPQSGNPATLKDCVNKKIKINDKKYMKFLVGSEKMRNFAANLCKY